MALFSDGPPSTMDDLTAQDSQLQDIACAENIDVTRKLSVAYDELSLELQTWLARMPRTVPDLTKVVVTPAIKFWHTFRTLELVYADAYNSQLNDRYAGRRDQFHARAKWASERLRQTGIAVVASPVAQAQPPRLIPSGGLLPDNTYYVTMAWLNAKGEEGAPAVTTAISTTGSSFLVEPLVPPPVNAAGWNIYAGTDPSALQLQNHDVIATGDTWLQPGTISTGLRGPGTGQPPALFKPVPRLIPRG